MITEQDLSPPGKIITPELINLLRGKFRLDWNGIHGVAHWARVRSNGLVLAGRNGANARIVEYFAFLHDVCRRNDGKDPDHGSRAALYARTVREDFIHLDDSEFALLAAALGGHTHGRFHDDITVLTCWDADRLDLCRVGIKPESKQFGTDAARDIRIMQQACENAMAWVAERANEQASFKAAGGFIHPAPIQRIPHFLLVRPDKETTELQNAEDAV